jgi:hypothetical protein
VVALPGLAKRRAEFAMRFVHDDRASRSELDDAAAGMRREGSVAPSG